MKKKYILSLLLLVVVSCAREEEPNIFDGALKRVKSFGEQVELNAEKIEIPSIGVYGVHIVDTFMIFNIQRQKHKISVYSANSHKHLVDLVTVGGGPDELTMVSLSGQIDNTSEGQKLPVFDINKKMFAKINLDKSIKNQSAVLEDKINLKKRYFKALQTKDDHLLIQKYDPATHTLFYLKVEKNDLSVKDSLNLYSNIKSFDEVNLLYSNDVTNSSRDKMVIPMTLFDQINILDINTGKKMSLTTSNVSKAPEIEELLKIAPMDRRLYYSEAVCSDTKIYALYVNQTFTDFFGEKNPVEIHVFDWSGRPLSKLLIKESIQDIALSKDGGYLYGLDAGENVYRYKL